MKGQTVLVNCESCSYASNISDSFCLRNLSCVFIDESNVDRIILRKGIDREYGGDVISSLKEISVLSEACLKLNEESVCKRECRKCRLNPSVIFNAIWRTMPDPCTDTVRNILNSQSSRSPECNGCISGSLESLDIIESLHDRTANMLNRMAYHVLEG